MIVGVDPGTTVGWAVLDFEGNVINVGSTRGLSSDELVAKLVETGRVFVVGSDKAKVPSLVQEVAARFGARAILPSQDLRVEEKREMTGELSFSNAHERDALASAVFAWKRLHPLLLKIRSALEREDKGELFESVAEIVVKDEISIRAALAVLSPVERTVEMPVENEVERDEDIARLYRLLSQARKDNQVLKKKNEVFERDAAKLKRKLAALEKYAAGLVKPKKKKEVVRLKEKQVVSLSRKLDRAAKKKQKVSAERELLESLLLDNRFVALPRLSHLGWEEVSRHKKSLERSVVFVEDPNRMSDKAVSFLRNKGVAVVVADRLPGPRAQAVLPFAFVKAERVKKLQKVVFVERVWLDKQRKEKKVLSRIVAEYQKRRSSAWRA